MFSTNMIVKDTLGDKGFGVVATNILWLNPHKAEIDIVPSVVEHKVGDIVGVVGVEEQFWVKIVSYTVGTDNKVVSLVGEEIK